ncbi:MAG: thiamine phosphate synthase [Dehalococcoidia bacterium]
MKDRIATLPRGLYVIIDPEVVGGRQEEEIARQAIEGGARLVQLRDKQREKGLQLAVARRLKEVCAQAGVPLIINDHLDLALASDADGVHVGQKDLPVSIVRRLMPAAIIGCSTNNVEEALRAQADGASYVSVGRLFPTDSKADTRPATLETLRAVKQAVHIPVAAIGGISEENIDAILAAGADLVAVIGAVVAAPDVREAARRLAERINEHWGRSATA